MNLNKITLPTPWSVRAEGLHLNINPERWQKGAAKAPAIRFRVSHRTGGKRLSKIYHNVLTLEKDAKQWGTSLNFTDRSGLSDSYHQQMRRATLYCECNEVLAPHHLDPLGACRYAAKLLDLMDLGGLEKLIAVYLPLLRKCQPMLVAPGVEQYRYFLFEDGVPETRNEKRKNTCLECFVDRFGGTQFLFVTVDQIRQFLVSSTSSPDTRNKYLYCLRGLFEWARDDRHALPATIDTVCHLVMGKKPDRSKPEIYSVRAFAWLASHAVDRDMVLALTLAGQHFVRQEEAERMRGEFFLRDAVGNPHEIIVPSDVSKTGVERPIPIGPRFRKLFKLLLPSAGPIFKSKHPFDRIRRLAVLLGIEPKKNGFRHSCVAYSIGAGMRRHKAAHLAGHDLQTQGAFYFVKVDQREANKYWRICFNLNRVARLPQFRRQNTRETFLKSKRKCEASAAASNVEELPAAVETLTAKAA
jgi:hypothetical protein